MRAQIERVFWWLGSYIVGPLGEFQTELDTIFSRVPITLPSSRHFVMMLISEWLHGLSADDHG